MMVTSCRDNANTNTNMDVATKDALIDQEIEASNAQLPMQVDYATTLLAMSRDDSIVTYQYELDENEVEFEDIFANQVSFRADLKEKLTAGSETDLELNAFLTLLSETGKVLRYSYTGNLSGQVVSLEFSNDEIKEMIQN